MGKAPWRIAFWKPKKSLAVINDVYDKTKEYSLRYKDIVELVEIIPSKSKTDDYDKSICCGIAGGDDALNAVSSSYRKSGIPILSLTGFKLSESSSTYPMLPSPRLSGLLFARAMLRSLRKVRDEKRIRVLLLTQSGDDAEGLRYKEFSDVLKFNTSMGVEVDGIEFDGKCINLEKKTFCAKTGEKTYSFDDVSKYDYVAVFGFGDKYNDWVSQLITACKRKQTATQFWCDYNYSSREVPNNLHRIGLKNCYGNKVFEAITCAAVDILVSGLSSNSQFAHDAGSFNSWLMDLTCFKSTYIDNILFTHGNHLPSFPFYCSSVGHPDTLLDAFEEDADYPAEESVKYLQETDGKVSAWLRNDKESDRELLDAITQNVLAKYYPILSVAVAYGDAKLASEGIETESVKLSKLLFGVIHDQPKDFVLQVNIDAEDIPNNDTQRLFVKNPRRDIKDPIPLLHYLRKTKDYCDDDSQATLLLGCQLEEAKTISMVDAKNILAILRTILDKARTSCIRYLYLIDYDSDYFSEKEKERKWIACVLANEKLDVYDCRICSYIIKSVLSAYLKRDRDRSIILANTKSAIGSIMSRNGSHNIGSHVLAALSHNVGTMPDDRVLYQYIQHRMDYIATATTDRPTWSQPTMFVGTMIKHFLTQRHLLNYISRSEGLKAWEFQSDRAKSERGGRIKLHVRKVDENGNLIHDFVKYEALSAPIDLSHDVTLAVPGGVVGQHAFFTIIENVIRNAAKHDWSTPPKSTAALKELPPKSEKSPSTGDLDIYIDFEDNPEMKDVHFTIWSRLSDVFDNAGNPKTQEKSLSPKEIRKILKANGKREELPLHRHQQVELAKSFITEQGDLRRENWGLAEMKISAGYLQKAKIEDIGGISDSDARYRIIVPCCVDDSKANDAKLKLNVKHLGYKFNVPKARQILFVVSQKPQALKSNSDIETGLRKNGIYIKTKEEVLNDTTCNYAYVVVDTFPDDKEIRQMPFRVIAMSIPKESNLNTGDAGLGSGESNKAESEDVRPVLNKAVSCEVFLQKVLQRYGNDTQQIAQELIEAVCECWVRHLRDMRNLSSDIPLYINTVGGSSGAGKSLVTDLDIVEYAFNEGIQNALNAFLEIGKDADKAHAFVDCLLSLNGAHGNMLVFDRGRELALIKKCKEDESVAIQFTREAIVKRQLCSWLTEWRKVNVSTDVDNAINYLNSSSDTIKKIEAEIEKSQKARSSCSDDSSAGNIKSLKKKLLVARRSLESPISALVKYLLAYCEQVSGLMSKYAETIATLPECFSKDEREKPWDLEWAGIHFWKDKVPFKGSDSIKQSVSTYQIRYWRHETERKTGKDGGCKDLYLEGLSGTQSYLNVLERFVSTDRFMQTRLVENALLRLLIVDERTRDFLEKHPSMFSKFEALGIYVANDKKVYAELERLEKKHDALQLGKDFHDGELEDGFVNLSPKVLYDMRKRHNGLLPASSREDTIADVRRKFRNKYEVIVIHQGIIDKWLPGASHDKKIVASFLASLEKVFRYVVITTGRGTPANIPNTARVLPFSSIQTSLFSQYPEKLLLTDAIMNILPVKGVSNAQK